MKASFFLNEKFAEEAHRAFESARDEAKRMKHDYMGTEHLLLGLIQLREARAAKILVNIGLDLNELRAFVEDVTMSAGDIFLPSSMPLPTMLKVILAHKVRIFKRSLPVTARLKKALEFSGREADALESKKIETEHLLLGLLREEEGMAATALSKYDVDYKRAYGELQNIIGGKLPS